MRVLVIEDEPRMAELLRQGLSEEGHSVVVCHDGREGLSMAVSHPFDLMVLDLMLPGVDGFAVVRRVRSARSQIPILILTARDTTADVVRALDLGADDYLTKPFSLEVLFARVRAVGRRGSIAQPVCFRIADLALNQATREVQRGRRRIHLTRTEYAILELLMRKAGRVVSRESLMETVWGDNPEIESNTLDAFVRLLRAKIEAPGEIKLIQTIRGIGYSLRSED